MFTISKCGLLKSKDQFEKFLIFKRLLSIISNTSKDYLSNFLYLTIQEGYS